MIYEHSLLRELARIAMEDISGRQMTLSQIARHRALPPGWWRLIGGHEAEHRKNDFYLAQERIRMAQWAVTRKREVY